MKARPARPALALALVAAWSLRAQPAPTPAAAPAVSSAPVVTVAISPTSPVKRVISPEVAAQLAASRPKFSPIAPPATSKPEAEPPDLRDTDKPRNEIIRLPKFMVREPKPPVFRERDFLDEAGRIALGMKRHPGLGAFPFAGLNAPIALQMLQEEARLEDMAAFNDLIRTAGVNDPAARGKLRNLWRQTYLRDNSWVVQRGVSWAEAKR